METNSDLLEVSDPDDPPLQSEDEDGESPLSPPNEGALNVL